MHQRWSMPASGGGAVSCQLADPLVFHDSVKLRVKLELSYAKESAPRVPVIYGTSVRQTCLQVPLKKGTCFVTDPQDASVGRKILYKYNGTEPGVAICAGIGSLQNGLRQQQ